MGTCFYCYAAYKHTGYPNIFKVDKSRLVQQIREAKKERARIGLLTRYLRLGKRTEAGADIFREQILTTLEACLETGISVIFPTKYLAFNRDIAELLRKTNSTVLFSLGNDELELGAVAHGKTNEWRLEQTGKYISARVRAMPYMLVDATKENGGPWFSQNLQKALQFPQVQLIPIRLRHREVIRKILGCPDNILGEQGIDMFGKHFGGYERLKDGTRLHSFVHPSLEKLIDNNNGNVRMCSHNLSCTWCGKCFMSGEKGIITETKELKIKRKIKRPHKKKDTAGTPTLF